MVRREPSGTPEGGTPAHQTPQWAGHMKKTPKPRRRWKNLPETPVSLRTNPASVGGGRPSLRHNRGQVATASGDFGWMESPPLLTPVLPPSTLEPGLGVPLLLPTCFLCIPSPSWDLGLSWGEDSLHGRRLCGVPPGWEELGSPKPARAQSGSWTARAHDRSQGYLPLPWRCTWGPSKSAPLPPR